MSEQITINNGGEAPVAVKVGDGAATPAGSQAGLMHQHGGQAPVTAASQASATGDAGGTPPPGGFVRAR